jgi:uncharacterized membrane protein
MSGDIRADHSAGRRGRLWAVVLILSLTLNVFFVGGLLWARSALHPPFGPVQRMESIAAEMHLSGDQLAAFRIFVKTMRDRQIELHEKNHAIIFALWDDLAQAQPDQAKMDQLVDKANDNRRASQKEAVKALIAFLATLSPEQRAQFADLAKKRHRESAVQRALSKGNR